MEGNINSLWHFPVMILTSLLLFFLIIRIVLGKQEFINQIKTILILSIVVVLIGMSCGKYGANLGLKWWIYYTIPMLMNVILPPIFLEMNFKRTLLYLGLSFVSAPLIHVFFSICFGWMEYMPFWKI